MSITPADERIDLGVADLDALSKRYEELLKKVAPQVDSMTLSQLQGVKADMEAVSNVLENGY